MNKLIFKKDKDRIEETLIERGMLFRFDGDIYIVAEAIDGYHLIDIETGQLWDEEYLPYTVEEFIEKHAEDHPEDTVEYFFEATIEVTV